jgi:hypothetical protein
MQSDLRAENKKKINRRDRRKKNDEEESGGKRTAKFGVGGRKKPASR